MAMASVPGDPQTTAQVNACLKDLYKSIKGYEAHRQASEANLNAMNAMHKKIENEERVLVGQKNKLKQCYEDGIKDAEKVSALAFPVTEQTFLFEH